MQELKIVIGYDAAPLDEILKPYAKKWAMIEVSLTTKDVCKYLSKIENSGLLPNKYVWCMSDIGIYLSEKVDMLYDRRGRELTLLIADDEAEVKARGDPWDKMMDVYKTEQAINFGRK